MSPSSLTIVLPCYNEEANVVETTADVVRWMNERGIEGEVIAVNDGSKDRTKELLDELERTHDNVRAVHHAHNKGYGAALRTGCDEAQTEWIAFMDSDGQFKAMDLAALLDHRDAAPFVTGKRKKRADPFIRKLNAKCFGLLSFAVLRIWVRDINCGMKLFHRDVWQAAKPLHATGALFNAEMFSNCRRLGIPWKVVDVDHYPRRAGNQTGANVAVILRMFRELLSLRRSLSKRKDTLTAEAVA